MIKQIHRPDCVHEDGLKEAQNKNIETVAHIHTNINSTRLQHVQIDIIARFQLTIMCKLSCCVFFGVSTLFINCLKHSQEIIERAFKIGEIAFNIFILIFIAKIYFKSRK